MDKIKELINISVDDLTVAPKWIMDIIKKEYKDDNKLIHINGWSVSRQDGMLEYEVYAMCFASTFNSMHIYKVHKWANMDEVYIAMTWVDTDELKTYMKELEEVVFDGKY